MRRSGTTMNPVIPTSSVITPATSPIWNAANPPVNPFCAEYMTVTRPSSLPIIVAMARQDRGARPATITMTFLILVAGTKGHASPGGADFSDRSYLLLPIKMCGIVFGSHGSFREIG